VPDVLRDVGLRPGGLRELIVLERVLVSDGVISLKLGDADGRALPRWTPGAHVDLVLNSTLTRQYSLTGDPADAASWQIAVLREPVGRGGSRHVHDQLSVGSTVFCGRPRNNFPLLDADRFLFIAGGIGITPIAPMVRAVDETGADWSLLYGGRARRSMAFLSEFEKYGRRVRVWPEDELGLLPLGESIRRLGEEARVYCCGPEPLLQAVEQICARMPALKLHTERFVTPSTAPTEMNQSIEVTLNTAMTTVQVPADKSILEAVEAAGITVLSSCRNGQCGTCETAVLEGVPDHRDTFLSAEERARGDTMLICVSRALTDRLVLDL
jgi:ferredoxin-NADP reductase